MQYPFVPVGGTPILPPAYLTVYTGAFFVALWALYFYFYKKKRPGLLWQKVKLLLILAFALKVTAVLGIGVLAAYWLVPPPSVRRTIPQAQNESFLPVNRVEIVFDRPVSRKELEKFITPEIPGRWVYEDSIYTTHLYRNLVFYPTSSFRPDTTYTIKLSNIRNLIKISPSYDYQFEFTTQASPKVYAVLPVSGLDEVDSNTQIKVTLDNPNNNMSEFKFQFTPNVEHEVALDSSKTTYAIVPVNPFDQGTKYNLKILKSDFILNLEDKTILERTVFTEVYDGNFTTKQAPGFIDFQPQGETVPVDSEILIAFSQKMDKQSIRENFAIDPSVEGQFVWLDDTNLSFKPSQLSFDTSYTVSVAKGTKSVGGGFLEEDLVKSFKTVGNVKVALFNPLDGWSGVSTHSPIMISFDQEVNKVAAQQKFSINPNVSGVFSWDGNTMVFTPEKPLESTTTYTVIIGSGVESIKGRGSEEEFKLSFSTQSTTTKLAVPAYLQKYTLSCEIAALRMALNFRGANVTEDDLIPNVGTDLTPHNGNIWGNPYNAFVGNIRGTQMKDGYGVYWGPIAKAARSYRNAQDFQGWNIEQLTGAISQGNPVVIWVYSHFGTPTSWNTPEGTYIYAIRDEHAVVAVGFVGPANAPTQLIINDPLSGQVYWSRSSFDKKWNIFGRSGVVVY